MQEQQCLILGLSLKAPPCILILWRRENERGPLIWKSAYCRTVAGTDSLALSSAVGNLRFCACNPVGNGVRINSDTVPETATLGDETTVWESSHSNK